MEKFEVNILGCGAAVPTPRHMTTAQLVNIHDKMFLVDCGEGTQTQIWKSGIKVTNMNLSLRHVSLPSTLKSIGIGAFQDCVELSRLSLPDGLEHLKLNAFKGCKALEGTLIIPSGCLDFEGKQVSTDNNND